MNLNILCTLLLFFTLSIQTFAQSPTPAPRVGNINPADKDKYRVRYEAKDNRFFSFGAARGIHLNNDNVLYAINMGYDWEVGATGALPIEAFAVAGTSTFYGDVGLGYKHFFSDEDFSPFIKGIVGAGVASLNTTENINGFSIRASVGATFFRTSTKHLELAASYGAIMKESSMGFPHIFAFTVGISY